MGTLDRAYEHWLAGQLYPDWIVWRPSGRQVHPKVFPLLRPGADPGTWLVADKRTGTTYAHLSDDGSGTLGGDAGHFLFVDMSGIKDRYPLLRRNDHWVRGPHTDVPLGNPEMGRLMLQLARRRPRQQREF